MSNAAPRLARTRVFAAGFLALGLTVTASVLFSVRQQWDDALLRHSLEVQVALDDVLSLLQDAEIGQRGYLLTGDPSFLDPYQAAIARLDAKLALLGETVSDNARQVETLTAVRSLAARKQAELAETLRVYQSTGSGPAIGLVRSRFGKRLMDELRRNIEAMDAEEDRLVIQRQAHVRSVGVVTALSASLCVVLMGALALGAMREVRRRASLERFLPAEIAPLLADGDRSLLSGGKRTAAIVFVDIRGSTRLAERLDPAAFSLLLSRFRRHVTDASRTSGGMIDKFMGDGALLVFGAVGGGDRAAAHAIAFARDLLERVALMTVEGQDGAAAPLRIGIGVHHGEVFCGVIGDNDRLEFTVLGDTVNVASRLEAATKRHEVNLLISEDVLLAATEPAGSWRKLSEEALPGREAPIVIYAPVRGVAD